MVQWLADTNVRGYVSGSNPSITAYHHLHDVPGSIDLGNDGVTRLHRVFPTAIPANLRGQNRIRVSNIRIRFTQSDFNNYLPPPWLGFNSSVRATLMLAPAAWFTGRPTPAQIRQKVLQHGLPMFHSEGWRTTPGDLETAIEGPGPGTDSFFTENTKYWVMVYPSYAVSVPLVGGGSHSTRGIPLQDTSAWMNSYGKAISLWTNRTPKAPLLSVAVPPGPINPETSITLHLSANDPDATGSGAPRKDYAGVQVQYAPVPTAANPNPTWLDLPFADKVGGGIGKGWYITQSRHSDATRDALRDLWQDGSIQIRCGDNNLVPGEGILPAGRWLIRARTFDYGHAFPGNPDVPPLARPRNNLVLPDLTPSNYAAANISPWSSTSEVVVFDQNLPPLLIRPINSVAVPEGTTTAFVWQHRNTAAPPAGPYGQKARRIEIREVGDTDWSVLADGASTESSLLVRMDGQPPSYEFHDPCESTNGWSQVDGMNVVTGPTLNTPFGDPVVEFRINSVPAWGVGYVVARRTVPDVPSGGMKTVTIQGVREGFDIAGVTELAEADFYSGGTPVSATLVSGNGLTSTGDRDNFYQGNWELIYEVPGHFDYVNLTFLAGNPGASHSMFGVADVLVEAPAASSGFHFLDNGSSTSGWARTFSMGTTSGPTAVTVDGDQMIRFRGTGQSDEVTGLTATRSVPGVPSARIKTVRISGTRHNGAFPYADGLPVRATLNQGGNPVSGVSVVSSFGVSDSGQSPGLRVSTAWEIVLEVPAAETFDQVQLDFIGFDSSQNTVPPLSGTDPFDFHVSEIEVTSPDTFFPLTATTQYEWRVQTTDTDDEVSNFSEIGRFWVVPAPDSGPVMPNPGTGVEAGTLGCGTHRVEVYRRGGVLRVGEITGISKVEWNRVRDDMSQAKVEITGWDVDCGNLLSQLQTWAYEIAIIRDNGYSQDRVWEGPITLLTYERDKVTIDARDVTAYLSRRIIRQTMNDMGGTPVTSRAAQIIQNAFAPDDPNVLAYLMIASYDNVPNVHRYTPAYSRTAWEEVDDMASNAGLDYTAVGRSIVLWGTRNAQGTLPEFRDEDLGSSPVVSEYGMRAANKYALSDGNGTFGFALAPGSGLTRDGNMVSGNDPVYGLLEMLGSDWSSDSGDEAGVYTPEQRAKVIQGFEESSERAVEDRYTPPVIVRLPANTTLNPDTVLSIQHLVPGVAIPLRSVGTLREVRAIQKLDSVKVIEEASREGSKEIISVTMSPFSQDDASMEAEE